MSCVEKIRHKLITCKASKWNFKLVESELQARSGQRYTYLSNGIDDLLIVVLAVDQSLLLQGAEVTHYLPLHTL